jgi:hypothetical protein
MLSADMQGAVVDGRLVEDTRGRLQFCLTAPLGGCFAVHDATIFNKALVAAVVVVLVVEVVTAAVVVDLHDGLCGIAFDFSSYSYYDIDMNVTSRCQSSPWP